MAHNGEQAVQKVIDKTKNECCKGYGLIFMDCNMPVMDGFEATVEIRKRIMNQEVPEVYIVACTALHEGKWKKKCIASGMNSYLGKPI